jgi:hypothetical protein
VVIKFFVADGLANRVSFEPQLFSHDADIATRHSPTFLSLP